MKYASPFAVVALSALLLAACGTGADTPSPSPSASATASFQPEPTPSPEPTSPTAAPTPAPTPTGSATWHEAEPIENMGLLGFGREDTMDYYAVGELDGERLIYVSWPDVNLPFDVYGAHGLYVLRGDELYLVRCPAADGPCMEAPSDWLGDGRGIDDDVRLDALNYPETVSPTPGWTLRTRGWEAWDGDLATPDRVFGAGYALGGHSLEEHEADFVGLGERTFLADVGASQLVQDVRPADIDGLLYATYRMVTPFGSEIYLTQAQENAYGEGAVTWFDGVDSFTHEMDSATGTADQWPVTAARLTCVATNEVIDPDHDPSQWRLAGTGALGQDVYLPAEGGNPIARAVYTTMKDNSWGEDINASLRYPYDTYSEFLDARSVFTWDRGDGTWVVAIDNYASQSVYSCV